MSQQLQPGEPVTTLMPAAAGPFIIDGVEIEQLEPRKGLVLGVAVLIGSDVHVLKPHELNRVAA